MLEHTYVTEKLMEYRNTEMKNQRKNKRSPKDEELDIMSQRMHLRKSWWIGFTSIFVKRQKRKHHQI